MEYIWDKLGWWWCLWQSVRTNNFWNGKWSLFFARALADFVNNKEMNTEGGKLFKRPEKSPPTNSPGMDVSPFPGMGRENCGIINEILTLREENNRNSHYSRHFFDWQVAHLRWCPIHWTVTVTWTIIWRVLHVTIGFIVWGLVALRHLKSSKYITLVL